MRKLFRILAMSTAVSVLALTAGFSSAYAADDAKKEQHEAKKKLMQNRLKQKKK